MSPTLALLLLLAAATPARAQPADWQKAWGQTGRQEVASKVREVLRGQ